MVKIGDTVEIRKGARRGQSYRVAETYVAFNGKSMAVLDIPGAPRGRRMFQAANLSAMKCQSRIKRIEHSGPNAPEMFTVYGKGNAEAISVNCLAHAVECERLGYRVEIILT